MNEWLPISILITIAGSLGMGSSSSVKVHNNPPTLDSVPVTSFDCRNRDVGYYADVETNCQAYHMCDGTQQYSYLCPHLTVFHQKFMVCNHFLLVNCSASTEFYHLNSKLDDENSGLSSSSGTTLSKTADRSTARKTNPQPIVSRFKSTFQSESINSKLTSQSSSIKNKATSSVLQLAPKRNSNSSKSSVSTKNLLKSKQNFAPLTIRPKSKTVRLPNVFVSSNLPSQTLPKLENRPIIKGRGEEKVSFKVIKPRSSIPTTKLRPLFVRSRKNFDQKSFTVSPPVPTTTPSSRTSKEIDLENISTVIQSNALSAPVKIPTKPIAIQQSLQRSLVPPKETPLLIKGDNQEHPTTLSISQIKPRRFNNLKLPSVRAHAAFFIPPSGLFPPIEEEINEILPPRDDSDHKMTMTFRDRIDSLKTISLPTNPNCPRCHPAFLRPNQCSPCVMIK